MSPAVPVAAARTDRAARFGRELERAMKTRGVGSLAIAGPLGAARGSIGSWRGGRMLPRAETARRLAEVLAWPALERLAIELRTKRCVVDQVAFVDDSGSDNRVYCSPACQRVAEKARAGTDRRTRAAIAERALAAHRQAVAAFCAACEPEGRCFAADCELRPVSPLPLFQERPREILAAVARPRNGYRERGADSARQVRVWAAMSPEEHAARVARAAEASRRARGLPG